MTQGRLLRQLIKAGAKSGDDDFRKAAEKIIQQEREKKHHLLANDLERILYGENSNGKLVARPRVSYDIPRDKERGLPLLEVRAPVRDFQDILLSPQLKMVFERLLLEQGRMDVLGSWGLHPMSRLLFCGPPGCGKTLGAEVIATELSLELVLIRFDAVVSSFLGETAANLRTVFDFINNGRFVALFDEFDAIGKEREDPSEHGELRRVVNSFLQMLDSYRGNSVVIAGTNHERLLDKALWRRFDEVLLFEKPKNEEIAKLMEIKLRGVRHDLDLEHHPFTKQFAGMSHADIERVLIRAIKEIILSGREFVTMDSVEKALQLERQRIMLMEK